MENRENVQELHKKTFWSSEN